MAALTTEYSDTGPGTRDHRQHSIVDSPGSQAASVDVTLCAAFGRIFPSGYQWAF